MKKLPAIFLELTKKQIEQLKPFHKEILKVFNSCYTKKGFSDKRLAVLANVNITYKSMKCVLMSRKKALKIVKIAEADK